MREIIVRVLLSSLLLPALVTGSHGQTRPRKVDQPPTSAPGSNRPANESLNSGSGQADETALKNPSKDEDVLRIDTTLVTVPVTVRDRNGQFITDLIQTDFQVFEDGIEQKIGYFARIDKPFTVILVLDTSASIWTRLGQIKDAAKAFVDQLPAEAQLMVTSFGMGFKVQCEPTADRKKIHEAIRETSKGWSTHLYDAMEKVMTKHPDRFSNRKAIVLFTDGVDATSNKATYESNIRVAEEVDAVIYSIRYDTYDSSIDTGSPAPSIPRPKLPGILGKIPLPIPVIGNVNVGSGGAGSSRADYEKGECYLQELAALTGGRVYEASKDLRYLQDAFSQIAAEVSRQYSIGYYPLRKGQTRESRQIRVMVNRPDVVVRSRSAYVYKDKSTSAPKDKSMSKPKAANDEPVKRSPVLQLFASSSRDIR